MYRIWIDNIFKVFQRVYQQNSNSILNSCSSFIFFSFFVINSISELGSLISISVHIQHLHEVVDGVVWVAADLLNNLTHSEDACKLLIRDEVDLISKVLFEHLLQGLSGLRERYKSGLAVVVRVGAYLFKWLYQQLAATSEALADLGGLQAILPMGQSGGLDRDLWPNGENSSKCLVPFILINDLIVSRINGVEHVLDDGVARHWRLWKLAELSHEGIPIQVGHAALPWGVEL